MFSRRNETYLFACVALIKSYVRQDLCIIHMFYSEHEVSFMVENMIKEK